MSTVKANYLVNAAGTGAPTLTNGAVLPAGSAAAPAISPTGDSNTGIFFPAADTIAFAEGGSEAMRIDSSGNVGIGATPNNRLSVSGNASYVAANIVNQSTTSGASTSILQLAPNNAGTYVNLTASFITGSSYSQLSGGGGVATSYTDFDTQYFRNNAGTVRAAIDSAGNFQFNSGYGSAATAYGCRAWVNFNGQGTVAIRGSGNVSSITDNGTGDFTVNFTTAMPDENYALTGMVRNTDADTGNTLAIMIVYPGSTILVGSCRVATGRSHTTSKIDFNANLITFVR